MAECSGPCLAYCKTQSRATWFLAGMAVTIAIMYASQH